MKYTGERLIIDNKECDIDSDIYQEHIARYKYAIKFIKAGDKVLDIACGSGYGSNMLAENGAQVWAGDMDASAVALAREKYNKNNLVFKRMDATELPFEDNKFDVVVSFETIEHIENYKKFINELKRVLKANGQLILSTPNVVATKKLKINNPFHIKEFTQQELLSLLSDFKQLKIYGQRVLAKLNWRHKLLAQVYYIYSQCKCLHFLSKLTSNKFKQDTGDKISGLDKDFSIKETEKGREYLYYIITGINSGFKF